MPTELTLEAAIIELNRLKTTERMEIDRERLTAAVDVLKDAARFRIRREPIKKHYLAPTLRGLKTCTDFYCPKCEREIKVYYGFCTECGQALDWSTAGCYEPLDWRSL